MPASFASDETMGVQDEASRRGRKSKREIEIENDKRKREDEEMMERGWRKED